MGEFELEQKAVTLKERSIEGKKALETTDSNERGTNKGSKVYMEHF